MRFSYFLIGDFLDVSLLYSTLFHLFCPQMAMRIKFGAQSRFEFADFFLVPAASLFTLRTFSTQINWRVISRKVLFDPPCFLSNKSPIQLAGESGKGNTFLNGRRLVQNENGHRSSRSQTNAKQL
jgi:hypothetical protein